MKKETEKLCWIWVGISVAIIIGIIANCRIDVHKKSYPDIKCADVVDTRMVYIESGMRDHGNGMFWRKDTHFEDNVKMIWCEINHGDKFYYSKYKEGYGTDFMNMRNNESVQCLMEFTEEVCT